MKHLVFLFFTLFLISSCTDSERAKLGGLGDEFKIELLDCQGEVIREWRSTGKVHIESTSNGYYFKDKASNRLVEVAGFIAVSYTHLRAHETLRYLVCRLLLEKKN